MGSFKTLLATEPIHALCAEPRNRGLLNQTGTLREYKLGKKDAEILRTFKKEYESKLIDDARLEYKITGDPRNYGPRELGVGTIASPERTISVFIPLALEVLHGSGKQPKVMYQPDRDDASFQEPLPWHVGTLVLIPGNSLIDVKEGSVCFEMVQYDWKPAKYREGEDATQGVTEAS